jgi:hypothetical protein
MGYAVRNDDKGWRAIDSKDDCASDETYSATQPPQIEIEINFKALKQSEIDALEASQYMTRGEREGWLALTLSQAAAQSISEPTLYSKNPFYKKLKDINTQITALRAELNAIV